MIVSFKDQGTEDIFDGNDSKEARRQCPINCWNVAQRKLDQLNAASFLEDIKVPPGNRLEALQGDRSGQHSVRINDQYRICFTWTPQSPEEVEIVDYHSCDNFDMRVPKHRPPSHPGEILLKEFLEPLGISQQQLADTLNVPYQRINEIVNHSSGITPSTALRLSRFFGNSSEFWLNLQQNWELYHVLKEEEDELKTIIQFNSSQNKSLK